MLDFYRLSISVEARLSISVATLSNSVAPRLSISVARVLSNSVPRLSTTLSNSVPRLSVSVTRLFINVATLSICFHRRSIREATLCS